MSYLGINIADITNLGSLAIFYLPDRKKRVGTYYDPKYIDGSYWVYELSPKEIEGLEYIFSLLRKKKKIIVRLKKFKELPKNLVLDNQNMV